MCAVSFDPPVAWSDNDLVTRRVKGEIPACQKKRAVYPAIGVRGIWRGCVGCQGKDHPPSGGRDRGPPKLDPLCPPLFHRPKGLPSFRLQRKKRKRGTLSLGEKKKHLLPPWHWPGMAGGGGEGRFPHHPTELASCGPLGSKVELGRLRDFDSRPPPGQNYDHG